VALRTKNAFLGYVVILRAWSACGLDRRQLHFAKESRAVVAKRKVLSTYSSELCGQHRRATLAYFFTAEQRLGIWAQAGLFQNS